MAVTLDATVAGATANAYLDVTAANAYFADRMYSEAWTSVVSDDLKKQALITATRRLDLLQYKGRPSTDTQALRWPREYVVREDSRADLPPDLLYGPIYWPSNTIPVKIQHACCELALWYLTKGTDPTVPDPLKAFNSVALPGGLAISLRGDAMPAPDALPDVVLRLLREFRDAQGTRVART